MDDHPNEDNNDLGLSYVFHDIQNSFNLSGGLWFSAEWWISWLGGWGDFAFPVLLVFSQRWFIVKSNNVRPRKSRYSWKDLTIKILEILMSNNVKIKTLQGRGQLWNEQTTPSQPKLKPGFRLSRHRLSLEKSWPWLLIGLISIADWSDLRDFIPVRTLRASWVGRLQVSCWNIWRPICTFFADCPKDCSHFRQKKKLTVTFNLYWFHSFMNLVFFLLSQNILSHHYILWSPCPHYPHPGDKKIKLRCFHPSSTRLGRLKGDPSFLHSSALLFTNNIIFQNGSRNLHVHNVPTFLLHGTKGKGKTSG